MTPQDIQTLATSVANIINHPLQPQKEWLTPDDVQTEFTVSKTRQANLRSQKLIPYPKRGRYIRYKRSDINEWFESAKVV